MKRTLIAIASILAIVAGCAKNNIENGVADGKIRATIESADTRATLNYGGSGADNYMVWQDNDSISIMDGTSIIKCRLTSEAGSKIGTFAPETETPIATAETYYAAYPGMTKAKLSEDGDLIVDFSNSLTVWSATNSANRNSIMVSKQTSYSEINFKNLCSYLRFTITGEDSQILEKLIISEINGKAVSGTAKVSFAGSEPSIAFDESDQQASVEVTFENETALSSEGYSFTVAVAPVFQDGFKVAVCLKDGSCQELSSNSEIGRNQVVNMPTFAFSAKDVAEIDGTKYKNLAAAIAAANTAESDVTISMLDNAFGFDTLIVRNATDKKVTFDLKGKTINANIKAFTSIEVTDSGVGGVIQANSSTITMGSASEATNATFTLNGGTIKALTGNYPIFAEGKKSGNQPNVLVKKGSLIAENGNAARIKYATATFGDETVGDGDIVVNSVGGIWTSTGSTVTLNKGTYTSTERIYYFGDVSCVVVINGGIFTSDVDMFGYYKSTTNPTATITAGKFSWDPTIPFVQAAHTKTAVSGGYFTSSVASCVATGYVCVESSEVSGYSYKVVVNEDKSVIKVGDKKFDTVAEGVAEANKATVATTITMLQDVEIQAAMEFTTTAPLTLDLNGHKIIASNTETATPAIQMDAEGVTLTIVDNSAEANGCIDQVYSGSAYTIIVNTGTLNIQSGTIRNTTSTGYGRVAIRVAGVEGKAAAHVNISGGHIYGGRAIQIGSGIATVIPEINITDGLIEARYASTTDAYSYGTLAFTHDYYYCKMTGGVLLANAGTCFYSNRKEANSTFIIGDPDDSTKIPYMWTKSGPATLRTGSGDASARVFIYNVYTNSNVEKNSLFSKARTVTVHTLDPVVKDDAEREYQYQIY